MSVVFGASCAKDKVAVGVYDGRAFFFSNTLSSGPDGPWILSNLRWSSKVPPPSALA